MDYKNCCNEMWQQDYWNCNLFERNFDVNADRSLQLWPRPRHTEHPLCIQKILNEYNVHCPNELHAGFAQDRVEGSLHNYRNIPVESQLRTLDRHNTNDCLFPQDVQYPPFMFDKHNPTPTYVSRGGKVEGDRIVDGEYTKQFDKDPYTTECGCYMNEALGSNIKKQSCVGGDSRHFMNNTSESLRTFDVRNDYAFNKQNSGRIVA